MNAIHIYRHSIISYKIQIRNVNESLEFFAFCKMEEVNNLHVKSFNYLLLFFVF
jgi:hypothetical protein